MTEKTKVFHKWMDGDGGGITLEIIFDKYRFGICFYPSNDCGWWLIGKTGEELDMTEEEIPLDVLSKIKRVLAK